jgi:hypothetical protein
MVAKEFFGWPFRAGVVTAALLATLGAAGLWLQLRPTTPPAETAETAPPEGDVSREITLRLYGGGVVIDGQALSLEQFAGRLRDKLRLAEVGKGFVRAQPRADTKLTAPWSVVKLAGSHHYPLIR